MKVILKKTIESLGIIGSVVDVAKGYARNYLFPQQLAVPATESNIKQLQNQRTKVDLQIAKERSIAEEMAKRLHDIECQITVKVSDEGRLYGSVSTKDIVESLSAMDIQVDKKMVLLKDPIKEVGKYKVPIRIYQNIEPEIVVDVVAE